MSPSPPRTLATQLALAYTVTFMVLLGAALAALNLAAATELDRRVDDDLVEDVDELSALWREGGDAVVAREFDRETAHGGHADVFLMLLDRSGDVLATSDAEHWSGVAPDAARFTGLEGDGPWLDGVRAGGREGAARTALGRLGDTRWLFVAESLEERDELLALLRLATAAVLLIAVPLASVAVWMIGRRATRGIAEVGEAATAIAGGRLERRVSPVGSLAEVQALAHAFNTMAERNEKLIGDMREMTDNVAHDLRSPLTRVRLIAETALMEPSDADGREGAVSDIVIECDRLITLINHALDVSEAEAGVSRTPPTRLDLAHVAADVTELFDALAEERGITLVVELAPPLPVLAERPALERVVANLVENAVKFTAPGGTIAVRGRVEMGEVVLTVEDDGPGIPPDRLERVFDRYYRVDDSRSATGCGLGLSYARAVARMHGGDLVARRAPGNGAAFELRLAAA